MNLENDKASRTPLKKVLIFAYYWPPAGGVAVQRFLKFSKFLPEFGWEPIIVTVKNGAYPYYDESLKSEVSAGMQVYSTKTFEPFEFYNLLRGKKGKSIPLVAVGAEKKKTLFQRFTEFIRANYFIPDARVGWVPYAVKQAEEILKTQKIDAVVTTGPPHSTHLIGLKLKQKHNIKWLADLRDPWTRIFYNELLPRTEATKQKDADMEREVLQTADEVTVISPGMKKQFAGIRQNIEVVFNGYDENDFQSAANAARQPDIFTIRYLGNFMTSQDIKPVWKAIAALQAEVKNIRLEFIGRVDNVVKESISTAGLDPITSYLDFVSHKEATHLTQQTSLLLFIIQLVEDRHLFLNSKLFEYLASGSEILSVGPIDGDAADVLRIVERKPMLDYEDYEGILAQLKEAYYQRQTKGKDFKYTTDKHKLFSRRAQTSALVKILNRL
jgi:glycosyltransferase involved in cell wall biosynthesis